LHRRRSRRLGRDAWFLAQHLQRSRGPAPLGHLILLLDQDWLVGRQRQRYNRRCGAAIAPKAVNNMVLTSFRYYLP
jgi:hypothetical protein